MGRRRVISQEEVPELPLTSSSPNDSNVLSPEHSNTPLATANARREAANTLAERRAEAPSQTTLDVALVTPCRTSKRKRGGPALLRLHWIKENFVDEVCTADVICLSAEKRNKCDDFALRDQSNHFIHLRCRRCAEVFHSHCESTYNRHLNHVCPGTSKNSVTLVQEEKTPFEFWHTDFPVIVASTSIPLSVALHFAEQIGQRWPYNAQRDDILRAMPKEVSTLETDMSVLEAKIWRQIHELIDSYELFGIALDGGTDQVLGEHIMVALLYVGPHHWVLPPMYHEKHGAFNGAQIGAQIVDDLRRRLGAQRLRKWAYLIVDGAAVNHVARQEAENELGELYRRLGILGENDFSSMRNAVQGSIAQLQGDVNATCNQRLALVPCISHFLNQVAKSALESWNTTNLFLLRKYFTNTFYSGAETSARKGEFRGYSSGLAKNLVTTSIRPQKPVQSYHSLLVGT